MPDPGFGDERERHASEGWQFLRNFVGYVLVPVFVAPGFAIVAATVWVCQELGIAGGWLLFAFFASLPVALVLFVLTIPSILATEAWLTRIFGIPISERKPAILSPAAVPRLSQLPRVARWLLIVLMAPLALLLPLGAAYLAAIELGITSGDLRGQVWSVLAALAVLLIAFSWFEPKASRTLDRWVARWDGERRAHANAYGRRPWWLHCLAVAIYFLFTLGIPLLLAFSMLQFGVRPASVTVPMLLCFATLALANLYLVDVLVMKLMRRFFTAVSQTDTMA